MYRYDKFGNLAARKDNINDVEETFTYGNYVQNPLKYTDPTGERAYGPAWYELLKEAEEYVMWERRNLFNMGMTVVQDHYNEATDLFNSNCTWGDKGPANNGGNQGDSKSDKSNGGMMQADKSGATQSDDGDKTDGKKNYYESPISDNCGERNGECVYRCLEEFSRSYKDINGGDFEYWCNLATQVLGRESINKDGTVTGVHPNHIKDLIDESDYFSCEEIFREDICSMTRAFSNEEDSRLMMAIPGHALMIQSITIDRDGGYTMRFAETNCVNRAGYYSFSLTRDFPGCRIFKISLKP